VREREDANRTREAGHRDEIEGVVAISLNLFRNGAVGFIVWLDEWKLHNVSSNEHRKRCDQKNQRSNRQKNKSKPARAYYEIS